MADHRRIEELQRRVQQDPASIAFAALADEYRRAGLFREAVEACRVGLQRHPAYLSARVTLGRALLELGELQEAEAELEQVVRAAPENLAAIRALAEIHRRRGDTPETAASDQPLASTPPPADNATTGPARVPVPQVTPAESQRPGAPGIPGGQPGEQTAPAAAPSLRLAPVAAPPAPGPALPVQPPAEPPAAAQQPALPPEPVVARVDPAIPRLEAFLEAIERARLELRPPV